MSRHRFRLEGVLRIRRAQEETARQHLAMANLRLRTAIGERERRAARYRTVPVSTGPVTLTVFARERAIGEMAAASLSQSDATVAGARVETNACQRQWSQAATRVEALERLRRRRLDEERADEALAEIATIDDLVTARWVSPLTAITEGHLTMISGGHR